MIKQANNDAPFSQRQLRVGELIKQSTTQYKGRIIAPKGQSLLDKASLVKSKQKKATAKKEENK